MSFETFHNNWTSWSAGGSLPTVTFITQAQFLSENPEAKIPKGHVGNIMKVVEDSPSVSNAIISSPSGLAIDHSSWRNMGYRWFVPKDNLSSIATAGHRVTMSNTGFTAERGAKFQLFGTEQFADFAHGFGTFLDDPNDPTWKYSGWNSDSGTYDNTDLHQLTLYVQTSSSASVGTPCIVYFFDMFRDAVDTTRISFSADDGTDTQYSVMFQSAKKSADNIPHTLGIISPSLDTGGSVTTDQLKEMVADNFDVAGHSLDALGTGGLTSDAQVTAYLQNTFKPFMANYGKNGGHRLWIWAGGRYRRPLADPSYPDTYMDLMKAEGVNMGRRTGHRLNAYGALGIDEDFDFICFELGQSATKCSDLGDVQTVVQKAIDMGVSVNFLSHDFVPTPISDIQFGSNEWPLVTAYLRQKADSGEVKLSSLAELAESYALLQQHTLQGILLEDTRTNLFLNSFVPATQTITVTAVPHTITVKGSGDITVTGVGAGVATEGSPLTITPTAGGLICTVNGTLTNVNVESASFGSSFIRTLGTTSTRSATSSSRSWPVPSNDISGYLRVRPQFNHDDDKGTNNGRIWHAIFNSDGNDRIFVKYLQNTDEIQIFGTIGGLAASATTTLNALQYSKDDVLSIRFRKSSAGIKLWVNATSVENILVEAQGAFTNAPNQMAFGANAHDGSNQCHQTVESYHIWHEAKSDAFLAALI